MKDMGKEKRVSEEQRVERVKAAMLAYYQSDVAKGREVARRLARRKVRQERGKW